MLWEFLQKNRDIATGYNKTSQARQYARRMWETVALNLNSHGDGAEKDWKGWCKYWNDYKSKLKKLAAAHRASQTRTGGGPSTTKPLTDIEKKFLNIMGQDFGSGLPGVRVEPFEDEETREDCGFELEQEVHSHESNNLLLGMDLNSIPNDIYQPGPSWRVDAPTPAPPPLPSTPALRPSSPAPGPSAPPIHEPPAESVHSPRLSPRRRRRRRESIMSAEAARRAIVDQCKRRNDIEEQRNTLLEGLLQEIKDIKQYLQTRWNEHSRGAE